MKLRKAQFTIDGVGERYEGFTNGSLWNGWANVLFTRAQAEAYVGTPHSAMGFEPDGTLVLPEAEWLATPTFNEEVGEVLYDMNGFCFVEVVVCPHCKQERGGNDECGGEGEGICDGYAHEIDTELAAKGDLRAAARLKEQQP